MRSKLSTGYGDTGWTQAGIYKRCSKDDAVLEVLGDLDEFNCWLGHIRELYQYEDDLTRIQSYIFELGVSVIENKEPPNPVEEDIRWIESRSVELEKDLPELRNFILPGFPSEVHIARAICRRVERKLCMFYRQKREEVYFPFINRLSDYLFILARRICYLSPKQEKIWKRV